MLSVKIRYFAGAATAAGMADEQLRLVGECSIADILTQLSDRGNDALDRVLAASSFLLNGVAVRDHGVTVGDGAELDVLPPFAGG
ncbi:MAG: MoaD/ThiS family protein [Sciscionella sp.]